MTVYISIDYEESKKMFVTCLSHYM